MVHSHFHLLYDYHRQRTQLRVVELTVRKLHIGTPTGRKLMPQDWVYKTDRQKNEWLIQHGWEIEDLDEQPQVTIYLEAV